jgi:putative transcriptional regulator
LDSVTRPEDGVLEELLASYAAGGLGPSMHALVASHLTMCPHNRRFVETLETNLAAGIGQITPAPIRRRKARLDAIFAQPPMPARAPTAAEASLPAPLRHYMRANGDVLRWRFLLPGVRLCSLVAEEGYTAGLYKVAPGFALPDHTHYGLEAVLVLTGAFSDNRGHYGRGEMVLADADIDHRPVADRGEMCVCFIVHEGGIRLTGPMGRVIERLFGRRPDKGREK